MSPVIPHHELVSLIKSRSPKGAELLYDGYAAKVYRILYARTGSAVQSEVLLEKVLLFAWHHIAEFDPSQQRFALWVMVITRGSIQSPLKVKKIDHGNNDQLSHQE